MHPYTIFSFIMQTSLVAGFILLSMYMVQQQSWYRPMNGIRAAYLEEGEQFVAYYETTVNFIHSSYQYIIIALVFSIGHPHRRPVYTNIPMIVSTLITVVILLLVQFLPSDKIPGLELADIPSTSYKFLMVGVLAGNMVLALAVEYSYRVIKPLQWLLRLCRFKSGHKNKFKYLIDELTDDGSWPEQLTDTIASC